MKKTMMLSLILVATAFNLSFVKGNDEPLPAEDAAPITTLIINADVTVVLVNNNRTTWQLTGDNIFNSLVTCTNTGDTLVIGSARRKDFTKRGTIYVDAANLRNIRINSKARVLSYHSLRIPRLDVTVNGECTVKITNIGEVNLFDTESYAIEQTREVRQVPMVALRK